MRSDVQTTRLVQAHQPAHALGDLQRGGDRLHVALLDLRPQGVTHARQPLILQVPKGGRVRFRHPRQLPVYHPGDGAGPAVAQEIGDLLARVALQVEPHRSSTACAGCRRRQEFTGPVLRALRLTHRVEASCSTSNPSNASGGPTKQITRGFSLSNRGRPTMP